MKHTAWIVAAALLLAAAAAAQTPPAAPAKHVAVVVPHAEASQQAPKFDWTQATPIAEDQKVVVHGKIVRGAPYSADKVTESVQVLADGNRIVKKTTSHLCRDSEGRSRTEEMGAQGVQSVTITDPVSGETWVLNPQTRTAFRAGVFVYSTKGGGVPGGVAVVGRGGGGTTGAMTTSEGKVTVGTIHRDPQAPPPPPPPPPPPASAGAVGVAGGLIRVEEGMKVEGKVTREDLGQQTIEGLTATGTRTTTVIPADAIGNEQPIRVVSEQWYSPELQMLVMTKFSDPRSGETTFRLTNVSRAEPDRSLFTVPPDYTVKESKIQRETR